MKSKILDLNLEHIDQKTLIKAFKELLAESDIDKASLFYLRPEPTKRGIELRDAKLLKILTNAEQGG